MIPDHSKIIAFVVMVGLITLAAGLAFCICKGINIPMPANVVLINYSTVE